MITDHKETYRAFAGDHDLPLFFQPWFLDAVCNEEKWKVSIAFHREEEIAAVWPYYMKTVMGMKTITLPPFTPYLGPLIFSDRNLDKTHSVRSYERKLLKTLHDQLPEVARSIVQIHPSLTNWRPLSWEGYQQSTRYTLRIDLRKRKEQLQKELKDKIRNQIAQAEKIVEISNHTSSKTMHDLTLATFKRQGKTAPYSYESFDLLWSAAMARGVGTCFLATRNDMKEAGIFVIRDQDTAYLMTTGRHSEAHSGAVALLIWKCIQKMKDQGVTTFDFEGSMMKGIALFFDAFGGDLVPYHRITRTKTKYHRLLFQFFGKI